MLTTSKLYRVRVQQIQFIASCDTGGNSEVRKWHQELKLRIKVH